MGFAKKADDFMEVYTQVFPHVGGTECQQQLLGFLQLVMLDINPGNTGNAFQ